MTFTATSAPGKLFLLGEYAVLQGAPALLSAVDRRVTVTVAPAGSWRLHAPSIGIQHLDLDDEGQLPAALNAQTRSTLRLFDTVRVAVRARASGGGPFEISIDSAEFTRDGHKLGLGSSAAVASALTAALAEASRLHLDRAALFALAQSAHRATQNGTGSGGDVAASVYGGLLSFTVGASPVALRWPNDLTMLAVVTGEGSATTDLVGRVNDFGAEHPLQHDEDLARLTRLAHMAQSALADRASFLRLIDDYFTALALLDAHAEAGIVTERHRELRAVAQRGGGVFKTSGAGGGDVGLAFSASGESAERLESALTNAGASVVALEFGAAGVES
ncbi:MULTISPECIES: mevalonate kinase [unclassified Cryobacterium]|uniref:mevalonate kinase family protein n=1 Tax=unclassified Cryobacterium TaxID=2649013 RepID=UPI0011B06A74|nr:MULTISPECIES: hypothetical protein [unclassified Cryobacterium]